MLKNEDGQGHRRSLSTQVLNEKRGIFKPVNRVSLMIEIGSKAVPCGPFGTQEAKAIHENGVEPAVGS
ncbi:MAG: hypothetical protein EBQ73_11495 [Gammaproteobacteria bacterium]|nr:hypothetical protein [Gammaproteobacteria bacterium]